MVVQPVYKEQVQDFALKSMKKIEIIGRNHQDQIYNERDLQMACNSQFIVRLYRTFKDLKYIYLLLEVCLGGDLWNHLHRQKKHNFDETSAKFYAGCVVEALAYLHQHGVIYRDLKPENLIIHTSGYLKLTDFGFAKKIDSKEKTYTFVGTAEYIAPEIILNKGHTKGVDYWALGVLIYELLVGRTPFKTNNGDHMKTYKRILKGIDQAAFPYFLSVKAKSLIKKLCTQSSSDRLGCQRGGINNIKNHPWFATLNWYQLTNCMIEPPFIPELENNFDTKYFEDAECKGSQESIPPDFHSAWDEDF
ncbi:hypothetical protein NQ317_006538 [Molorchus minor]|uniref:cGMP-dependent protein kinase n=1 Tax=Molorchus minor TaxID=1323400 RepID=A0ABQ9J963_9CUCU|nr:hypothetical protein NQ317_006538 [Molorchus minor]